MYKDMTLTEFFEKIGSKSAVPGGGGIAAMTAASAAALTEMVANLTIGKKNYENVEKQMQEIVKIAKELREKFLQNIDEDAKAFETVMSSFKYPKETEEEKTARKGAIQAGFKKASLAPLEVANEAFKMMELIYKVVENGNKNAVTDGVVAAMMAKTAILSSLFNVKTNLNYIEDKNFVEKVDREVKILEGNTKKAERDILEKIKF